MSRNDKTIAKFKQMEELYMYPKRSEVSKRVKINNSILSDFLNKKRNLSDENYRKLNKFLDARLDALKETV